MTRLEAFRRRMVARRAELVATTARELLDTVLTRTELPEREAQEIETAAIALEESAKRLRKSAMRGLRTLRKKESSRARS